MSKTPTFQQLLSVYGLYLHGKHLQAKYQVLSFDYDHLSLPLSAFHLWLKVQVCDDFGHIDEKIVDLICQHWSESHKNLITEEVGVFTSNLANYFACLQEVKNKTGHSRLQQTMTKIRDYLFDHMIKDGCLIGSKDNTEITYDELLSVLPFGVFAPEDLIVVAAKEKLVERNSDCATAQALLGIYFTEKFELDTAKQYLERSMECSVEGTIASELLSLLKYYLSQKIGSSQVEFIHKPYGHGNVYNEMPQERLPHYPSPGELCFINVQVAGSNLSPDLCFTGKTFNSTLINKEQNIWQFSFYITSEMNLCSYYFKIDDGKVFKSKIYRMELSQACLPMSFSFEGCSTTGNYYLLATDRGPVYLKFGKTDISISLLCPDGMLNEEDDQFLRFDTHNFIIYSSVFCLELDKNVPFSIHELSGQGIFKFNLNIQQDSETQYYGFGERFNSLVQHGEELDCFVYNQYRGQGTKTYIPMPFFITNKGFGIFVDTFSYTKFDLQKNKKDLTTIEVEFVANEPNFRIVFFNGSLKEMICQFNNCRAQPKMVPAWALGPWMSSNNWDRQSVVIGEVEKTKQLDIPATVIVLEQWSDEATYYLWNDAEYLFSDSSQQIDKTHIYYPDWGRWPDPEKLIEHCHDQGLKFILWQVPIVKYLNGNRHLLKDRDEEYILNKDYVVKNKDNSPYRIPENWYTDSLLFDFTNPDAKAWWFGKRQYLLDMGVDGFKTDGGEMVFGHDLKFFDGSTGKIMRNKYPNSYIGAYYNFVQQNGGITFSRSGYTGCNQFPAHWAGDERSTFDAFQRSLIAGLNAGISGIVFWGWDLAGFNGDVPSAELFMRATQMATFCPIMQYHAESKGEFNQDRTPWNIAARSNDERVISVYRTYANVRMNLLPYIYWQSLCAIEERLPLMKTMIMEYPDDARFVNTWDQYFFGKSLLIAPVIHEGETYRSVQLPKGRWVNFWTYEVFDGSCDVRVEADVNSIPVFIKENSVIPLNIGSDGVIGSSIGNDIERYQNLHLMIAASGSFSSDIYDHLGNIIHVDVIYDGNYTVKVTGIECDFKINLIRI